MRLDNLYDKWILQTSLLMQRDVKTKNFDNDKSSSLELQLMSVKEKMLDWIYQVTFAHHSKRGGLNASGKIKDVMRIMVG